MSRSAEFRANAEAMFKRAEEAELPAVRARLLESANRSLAIAQTLERSQSAARRAPEPHAA